MAWDWVRRTPLLATRTVEIAGARRLDEATVRAAAAIEPGTNLFAVDVAATEARVAGLPGVRRAHVVRHLPGRVTVLLEEREPYALVNAGGLHWVDAEGYLVTTDARPGATGLPILTGIGAPAPGTAAPSEGLRAGLALLHVLQRTSGRVSPRASPRSTSPVPTARCSTWSTGSRSGSAPTAGATGWRDSTGSSASSTPAGSAWPPSISGSGIRSCSRLTARRRRPARPGRRPPRAGAAAVGDPATLAMPAAAGLERR